MKLGTYLVGVPVVVVSAVIAIANRQLVTFSLDPFSLSNPAEAVSVRMPLFVLLLLTLGLGAILGGIATAFSRARRDRAKTKAETGKSGTSRLPLPFRGTKPPEE